MQTIGQSSHASPIWVCFAIYFVLQAARSWQRCFLEAGLALLVVACLELDPYALDLFYFGSLID